MQTPNPFPGAVVVFKRETFDALKTGTKRLIGPKDEGTYPCVIGVMTHKQAIEYWLQEWETNKNEDYSLFEKHWDTHCLLDWNSALHLAGYMNDALKDPELVARIRMAKKKEGAGGN